MTSAQSAIDKPTVSASSKLGGWVMSILFHGLLTIGAIFMLLPFLWMLSSAVKSSTEIFVFPPQWIPDEILWQNFAEVWTRVPMGQAYVNSIKISVLVTFLTLIVSSLAGFAFAKIEFPAKKYLFGILLATMMIPSQVTLVPVYILMARIGWIDTHWPLISRLP